MSTAPSATFSIDGITYRSADLPPEGLQLLQLLSQAQTELLRLQSQATLIQTAQKQILSELKPLLPAPQPPAFGGSVVLGQASPEIPTTAAPKPEQEPAPFPGAIPASLRAG